MNSTVCCKGIFIRSTYVFNIVLRNCDSLSGRSPAGVFRILIKRIQRFQRGSAVSAGFSGLRQRTASLSAEPGEPLDRTPSALKSADTATAEPAEPAEPAEKTSADYLFAWLCASINQRALSAALETWVKRSAVSLSPASSAVLIAFRTAFPKAA